MKKLFFFASVFVSLLLNAQVPQGFNYQALIRDSSNKLVNSKSIGLQMTIIKGDLSGEGIYQESFMVSTSKDGAVNIVIGKGKASKGEFSKIDWSNGPYFVQIAVDLNNGIDYQIMGTQQLMSVPYALYAENVSSSSGVSGFDKVTFRGIITESDPDTLVIAHKLDVSKILGVTISIKDTNDIYYFSDANPIGNSPRDSPFSYLKADKENLYLSFKLMGAQVMPVGCTYKITVIKEL